MDSTPSCNWDIDLDRAVRNGEQSDPRQSHQGGSQESDYKCGHKNTPYSLLNKSTEAQNSRSDVNYPAESV